VPPNLLNDNQQRRLTTHLRLLASDLETLADSPELQREGAEFARVREAIAAAQRATAEMQAGLSLPLDHGPGIERRAMAVAEVWAARVEDLRARRLKGYGAVHPALSARLDPYLDRLRDTLGALAAAAAGLTEDPPGRYALKDRP
jgi:hypothetical protein